MLTLSTCTSTHVIYVRKYKTFKCQKMDYLQTYSIMLGNSQTKLQFEYANQKSMGAAQACLEDIVLCEPSQSQGTNAVWFQVVKCRDTK